MDARGGRAVNGEKIGAIFFRGTKPIDGILATPDVVVTGACVMLAKYGVDDHQMSIVDLLTSSLVDNSPPHIVRYQSTTYCSRRCQETEHKHP